MNKSTRLLVTAAAMAGLYAGALAAKTYAADSSAGSSDTRKKMRKAQLQRQELLLWPGWLQRGRQRLQEQELLQGKVAVPRWTSPRRRQRQELLIAFPRAAGVDRRPLFFLPRGRSPLKLISVFQVFVAVPFHAGQSFQ